MLQLQIESLQLWSECYCPFANRLFTKLLSIKCFLTCMWQTSKMSACRSSMKQRNMYSKLINKQLQQWFPVPMLITKTVTAHNFAMLGPHWPQSTYRRIQRLTANPLRNRHQEWTRLISTQLVCRCCCYCRRRCYKRLNTGALKKSKQVFAYPQDTECMAKQVQ